MTLNPAGYVPVFDLGTPQVITATVNTAVAAVSGGMIAYLVSGTSAAVTSGLASVVVADFQIAAPASGINFPVGIVVQNAVSGAVCSIALKGVFILPASTALTAGDSLACVNGANAVDVITSGTSMPQLDYKQRIGKALTSAASGGFVVALVDTA